MTVAAAVPTNPLRKASLGCASFVYAVGQGLTRGSQEMHTGSRVYEHLLVVAGRGEALGDGLILIGPDSGHPAVVGLGVNVMAAHTQWRRGTVHQTHPSHALQQGQDVCRRPGRTTAVAECETPSGDMLICGG